MAIRGTLIEVTPVISTGAYTSGDQLGDIQTLTGVNFDAAGGMGCLEGVTVVDKAQQKIACDLFFFDESPTVASVDNGAIAISDAEMADKCLGHLAIVAGDYKDIASTSSIASLRYLGMALKPFKDGKIYVVAVTRGTPTYGSTSDLVFKYHFTW